MRSGLLLCAAVLAAGATYASQDPKARKKADDRPVIVVTGCVEGTWLRVQRTDAAGTFVERYKLRGSRQLMSEVQKQLKGHQVEVTGAVTDTGETAHRGKTIEVGKKTRISTGVKDAPQYPTGTGDPVLEVDSYKDLKDRCK
jgi:hypothetical protein